MHRLEPRERITYRIICDPTPRASHQQDWPEVEVARRVTVLHRESWGTDSATYEVVARRVVDIRQGHTREAFEEASRLAGAKAERTIREIEEGHPR